jgi:uncharacterized repeat protein (TIGR03803 family)
MNCNSILCLLRDSLLVPRSSLTAFLLLGFMTLGGCNGDGSSGSPALTSIQITPTNPSVAAGTSVQLTATAIYSDNSHADVTAQVSWATSNTAVATVGASTGRALGVAAGTATLSASLQGQTAGRTLTVTPARLVSIAITPPIPSIAAGATEQFTATGTYSDNSTKILTTAVTWASSDTSVAVISNAARSQGLATGLVVGSTSISAALGSETSPTVTLTVTAQVESVLYSFGSGSDGQIPIAGLIQGADGNFYGTTLGGGANGNGTVFKITPAGVETVLWSFSGGSDGQNPAAGLILGTDGNFYGETGNGGANGGGTVFKITPAGVETVLWSFGRGSDGQNPIAGLIQGADGNFYGTTQDGGTNGAGTVFKVTPAGVETVLWSFGSGSDGQTPQAGLIQGTDGNFYGTTVSGSANGNGMVFKLTPAGVETVLHSFAGGSDGLNPAAGLILGTDGNFYGTTLNGGTNGDGTVFKITPAGVETVLHSFAGGSDGWSPQAGLIQGADGNFYGTTLIGGTNGDGTVFKITPAGVETVLHSFAGGSDGQNPQAGLIQGADGNFYGTTFNGGANGDGTVFKF